MNTAVSNTVVNSIVIHASVDRVYQSCVDIDRWPSIFDSCRQIRRTEIGPDEIIMEMTVSNELGGNNVRSHRRYDPSQFRIDFEMLTLPAALAEMDGDWTVQSAGRDARLVVVHNFVPHGSTDLSAAELSRRLFQVTEHMLAELKDWIEADDKIAGDDAACDVAACDGGGTDLHDAYGARTSANSLSASTFVSCELFFSRLILGGLDWGDITLALKDVKKDSTFEDWADWHDRWFALGRDYEQRARRAFSAGFLETGRVANRRAATCYHAAEFMYFDAPELKMQTRSRVTEVFEFGLPYLQEVVRPFSVPYNRLDMPGYLLTPRSGGPWPCVILINGLDSAKEVELYAFAREFLARGMCAAVFDGPGQGLLAGRAPMIAEFEQAVGSVLQEVSQAPEVDRDRIGLFGVSFGGYLAARAAATLPGIRACINLSGGFDHENYRDLNVMVKKDFQFVFDISSETAMAEVAAATLNLRDIPPLQAPLLAIHGELDSIIPLDACERMLEWASGETALIRYAGERHVATNYFGDYIPRFCDWMAERLGAVTS